MTGNLILSRFSLIGGRIQAILRPALAEQHDLGWYWQHTERLSKSAVGTPVVQRTLDLLGPLNWKQFPERNLQRHWAQPAVSYAAFTAACLVKLNEGLESMGDLRQYLVAHPALIAIYYPQVGFSR